MIYSKESERYELESSNTSIYTYISANQKEEIQNLIRERKVDAIISLAENTTSRTIREVISLARIYGIPFVYPKLLPGVEHLKPRETFF